VPGLPWETQQVSCQLARPLQGGESVEAARKVHARNALLDDLQIADAGEVEPLDLKASILLLFNALQVFTALLLVALEGGHEAVARVALAPRLTAAQERDDDLAPHADDALADADTAALHGLGVGEPHEGRAGGDFVRGGGVVRCHVFKIPRPAWNATEFFMRLKDF
jgi:hypothetical protein